MRFFSFFLSCSLLACFVECEELPCKAPSSSPLMEEFCETTHQITLNGKELSYKATVGSLLIKNEKCESIATLSFTSYNKVEDSNKRPITFCFNGGPGSSSIWLHMGFAGPKRVDFSASDKPLPPPYKLTNNPYSLLDLTDLVFIDPVSTGFSQAIPVENAKDFYTTKEDVIAMAKFIQSYLTTFNRWGCPKFIMGESYGTTRAASLASYLHEEAFLDVNGLILISAALDYQTLSPDFGNDLPYLLALPSYTATAWHHKKLSSDASFDKLLEDAKNFSSNQYCTALFKGSLLSIDEKKEIASRIAQLTGVSSEYVIKNNLRVPMPRFAKELLFDQNKVLGCYDSQVTGFDFDRASDSFTREPSMDLISSAFTTCFNAYLQNDLNCKKESYKVLCDAIYSWDFNAANQYLNVSAELRSVITKNPFLQVFVASGYFDLVTPFFATEYIFNQLDLPSSTKKQITMENYKGGHMMYLDPKVLQNMKEDLSSFYEKAIPNDL